MLKVIAFARLVIVSSVRACPRESYKSGRILMIDVDIAVTPKNCRMASVGHVAEHENAPPATASMRSVELRHVFHVVLGVLPWVHARNDWLLGV